MMTGFAKVFWGLMLVFLDIRMNQFDILPDLLGYILVYAGLSGLSGLHEHFRKAKAFCIPLLIVSIFELLSFRLRFEITVDTAVTPVSFVVILMTVAFSLLDLFMIYHLCKGIGCLAKQAGAYPLEEKARQRWTYYLWIAIVMTLFPFLAFTGAINVLILIFIPFFVASLIVFLLILLLVREADRMLPPAVQTE